MPEVECFLRCAGTPWFLAFRHDTSTVPTGHRTVDGDARLRTYGLVGAVASLVGAASALVLIAWEPRSRRSGSAIRSTRRRYVVAQSFFALQHLAMLPLFLGLLVLERRHPSRALRIGTWIALVGQVLLTVMSWWRSRPPTRRRRTPPAQLVGALYTCR